jgi:hypothetical protein
MGRIASHASLRLKHFVVLKLIKGMFAYDIEIIVVIQS